MLKMKHSKGFTIVELLIVIVVIGILAGLVFVQFNNAQARSRDSRRKQDVAEIARLLQVYGVDHGSMYTGSGCGANGGGSGWFNAQGGIYTKSMMNCLIDAGVTSTVLIDPSGQTDCSGLSCRAYMRYICWQGSQLVSYVYANLESVGHTSTDTDNTCHPTGDTSHGMNYFVKINH